MPESRKGRFLLLEDALMTISTGKYRIHHVNQEISVIRHVNGLCRPDYERRSRINPIKFFQSATAKVAI